MDDQIQNISLPDLLTQSRPILLDGALGTELSRLGVSTKLPLWSAAALAEAPQIVLEVHQRYVGAGAQIITANTFRTTTYSYALAGLSTPNAQISAQQATATAIHLAREAAQGKVLVAGSVAPVADCYTPQDYPGPIVARQTYSELIPWIAEAGADMYLLETQINLEEALLALELAVATGLPVLVSFLVNKEMQLYSGTPLNTAVQAVDIAGASGVLVNCVTLPLASRAVAILGGATKLPFGVYANGGVTQPELDGTIDQLQPESEFLSAAATWLEQGCTFIGGCCGTTPSIISVLAEQIA